MHPKLPGYCIQSTANIKTFDNERTYYPYTPQPCWTLVSSDCGPRPVFAVFSKKLGDKLAVGVYVGGHKVEFTPNGDGLDVTVNGDAWVLADKEEKHLVVGDEEIFK